MSIPSDGADPSARAERSFLFTVGGIGFLAGTMMAVRPELIAASASHGATTLALLATRELGLMLAALGALAASVGRSAAPPLRRRAIAVFGALCALLGLNHLHRIFTEAEPLFAPAHSHGEIAALFTGAIAALFIVVKGSRSEHD